MKPEAITIECDGCGTRNSIQKNRTGKGSSCIQCGGSLQFPTLLDYPVMVTDQSFKEEVLAHQGPVLVDCWAEWCAPCSAASRIMEQLAKTYAGRIKIAKLNVDQNPETASDYGILSLPTLLFFNPGEKTDVLAGEATETEIIGWLDARI